MSNYIFHTAASGERWDTIAKKYYGNSYKIASIIMSNPHIPISPYLKEGTEVKVPINETTLKTDKSSLPVWRQ